MALPALFAVLLAIPVLALPGESAVSAPAATPTGRATLEIVRISPLAVAGHGFKPNERIRVSVDRQSKSVTAGARGSFEVAFPAANTCNGVVVAAVGSGGNRASATFAQFSNVHCLDPPPTISPTTKSTRTPALRVIARQPLTVRGDAFKPGERVRLTLLGSLKRLSRTTTADERGAFKASFRLGPDRCSPLVVAAVGSMGSRASAKVLVRRPCTPPRVPPSRQ